MPESDRMLQVHEAVPDAIAQMATSRGLGKLREAFRPKQRWMIAVRSNDSRLYLYEHGLVVTDSDHPPMAFVWDFTTTWSYQRTMNGALTDAYYTLVGPERHAVTIGRGTPGVVRPYVDGAKVTEAHRGAHFLFEGVWGPEIEAGITRTQAQGAWVRLRRGETLDFHKLEISLESVQAHNKSIRWADVTDVRIYDGALNISAGRDFIPMIFTREIPNLMMLMTLIKNIRNVYAQANGS
ncbi:DUF6585 family protein [Nocardia sp. NPDC127526]|uniref:DUF6585 family protein n=1 Tax=Nocardia sp. NPDC127526 TaxID=3345393 RepID=UPI00363131C6